MNEEINCLFRSRI